MPHSPSAELDSPSAELDCFRAGTAPLRRMEREWTAIWSEQLDARINPSVSGAARVSSLIRDAAATGQGGLSLRDARLAFGIGRATLPRSG